MPRSLNREGTVSENVAKYLPQEFPYDPLFTTGSAVRWEDDPWKPTTLDQPASTVGTGYYGCSTVPVGEFRNPTMEPDKSPILVEGTATIE